MKPYTNTNTVDIAEEGEGSSSFMMHHSTQIRDRSRGLGNTTTLSVVNLWEEKGASTTLQVLKYTQVYLWKRAATLSLATKIP